MHEIGIAAEILRIVEATAQQVGLHTVTRIKVVIGDLRLVKPDSLIFAFTCIRDQSCAETAILEIESNSGRDLFVDFLEGE